MALWVIRLSINECLTWTKVRHFDLFSNKVFLQIELGEFLQSSILNWYLSLEHVSHALLKMHVIITCFKKKHHSNRMVKMKFLQPALEENFVINFPYAHVSALLSYTNKILLFGIQLLRCLKWKARISKAWCSRSQNSHTQNSQLSPKPITNSRIRGKIGEDSTFECFLLKTKEILSWIAA